MCKDCAPGTFTDSTGKTKCSICPLGRYEDQADGTGCEIVPAGYVANDGGTGLKACGVGSYSDVAGLTACKLCSPGSYTSAFVGSTCELCVKGYAAPDSGQWVCDACGFGKYSDEVGATACKDCGTGWYQPASAGSMCTACVPGTSTNGETGVFQLVILLVLVWFLVTTGQAIDVLRKETRDRDLGRRVCVLRACIVGNLCGNVDAVPAYTSSEADAARSGLVTKSGRGETPVCCERCPL